MNKYQHALYTDSHEQGSSWTELLNVPSASIQYYQQRRKSNQLNYCPAICAIKALFFTNTLFPDVIPGLRFFPRSRHYTTCLIYKISS